MSNEYESNQNNELERQTPVTEESVTGEPAAEEPVTNEPVTEEAPVKEASEEEAVSEEPAETARTEEPVTGEPVAEAPAAEETVSAETARSGEKAGKKKAPVKYVIAAVCAFVAIILVSIVGIFAYKAIADEEDEKQNLFTQNLVCVMKDGKWGYVNRSGKMIIDAEFDDAYSFSECGLAMVGEKDGDELLYGYINKKGDYVIQPKYRSATSFDDKLKVAAVQDGSGEWGVINSKGERIVKTKYKSVYIYECGVIIVVDANDEYGLFSVRGELLLKTEYKNIDGFVDDKETAVVDNYIGQGIINKKGEFLIEAEYKELKNLNKNGYGWYLYDGKWGIIDKNGKEITDPEYDEVFEFCDDDVAIVGKMRNNGMKYGIVNRKGEELVKPKYETIMRFGEEEVTFFREEKDGKWGIINTKGKVILDCEFDNVGNFYYGYARAEIDGDYYLIDNKGNETKAPNGCMIMGLHIDSGLILIRENNNEGNGLYGYMDKNGKMVIDCQYSRADDFADCGIAITENDDGRYEYINKKGKIIGDEYVYATPFLSDGYAVVCHVDGADVKFGVINKRGQEVIKAEYDDIKVNGWSTLYFGISDIVASDEIDLKGYLMNIVRISVDEETLGMTYEQFAASLDSYNETELKSLVQSIIKGISY